MDTNNKLATSFFLLFLFCSHWCTAQHVLLKEHIHFRPSDTIVKQEVVYKHPGRGGDHVLWDFSELSSKDESYRVCYGGSDSLPTLKESHTVYDFSLNGGDALYLSGYQNGTTRYRNLLPELAFRYPLHYKDSLSGYFYGEGRYGEKLCFVSQGSNTLKADAWGMLLLPGGDTLRNVTRVSLQKEICGQMSSSDSILLSVHGDSAVYTEMAVLNHLRTDSVRIKEENYRWYAEGYRYPVFETKRWETIRQGSPVAYREVAFYYPPEYHDYLATDAANEQLQEHARANNRAATPFPHLAKEEQEDAFPLCYNIYPNPVKSQLSVSWYLSDASHVEIKLFDMAGRLYEQQSYTAFSSGIHQVTFDTGHYPRGHYLLQLVVNGETFVEKITKE